MHRSQMSELMQGRMTYGQRPKIGVMGVDHAVAIRGMSLVIFDGGTFGGLMMIPAEGN